VTDARRVETARARAARRLAELQTVFDAMVESSAAANLDDEHEPAGAPHRFGAAPAG
jgi:hypothetical protein